MLLPAHNTSEDKCLPKSLIIEDRSIGSIGPPEHQQPQGTKSNSLKDPGGCHALYRHNAQEDPGGYQPTDRDHSEYPTRKFILFHLSLLLNLLYSLNSRKSLRSSREYHSPPAITPTGAINVDRSVSGFLSTSIRSARLPTSTVPKSPSLPIPAATIPAFTVAHCKAW